MKTKRAKVSENRGYTSRIEVQSESDPKKKYIVSVRGDKRVVCSCHRWIMFHNTNGGDCKHIKAVKAKGYKLKAG